MPPEQTPILRLKMGRDLAVPTVARPSERLFVEVQHGLGNRLRAMASAAAIAADTGRKLVVVWTPDSHCQARLGDLIRWPGAVEEAMRRPRRATLLNYMEAERGATKGAPLLLLPGRDAWFRSAYVATHPASTWAAENRALQRLRPSEAVEELIAAYPGQFDIGIHVRNEGAPGQVLASYDRPENWTPESHAQILHWRGQSSTDRFIRRLRGLLADQPSARVFLAADQDHSYRAFATAFGDHIHRLERPCHDRSVEQLRHAMADILLLARSRLLLRSNWSSFSEAAMRLSRRIERHETAGIDF